MSELPTLVRVELEQEYGAHCLSRVTPGMSDLLETTLGITWASLPPFVQDVRRPRIIAIASEHARTVSLTPDSDASYIVFNEGLQRFFASITHHVVAHSDPRLIRILFERFFAARLYLAGRWVEAAAVGMYANDGITGNRGGRDLTADEQPIAARLTRTQTIFSVAHEIWHVVQRTTAGVPLIRRMLDAELSQFLRGELTARAGGADLTTVLLETERRLSPLLSMTGETAPSLDDRWDHLRSVLRDEREYALREELLCDLYGSLATLQTMTALGVSQGVTISGCILALLDLAVFAYLDAKAMGQTTAANKALSDAVLRVQVLSIHLMSRVAEGEIERGLPPRPAVEAVAQNISFTTGLYQRVVEALTYADWDELATMLLAAPPVAADARRLAEDRAHLSGLVGFAYPGYR